MKKQIVIEIVIALGIVWAGCFALAGCAVDQAKAYQIIKGGK